MVWLYLLLYVGYKWEISNLFDLIYYFILIISKYNLIQFPSVKQAPTITLQLFSIVPRSSHSLLNKFQKHTLSHTHFFSLNFSQVYTEIQFLYHFLAILFHFFFPTTHCLANSNPLFYLSSQSPLSPWSFPQLEEEYSSTITTA